MICANPDIVVERGDALIYCAGAIADRYAEAGGEVIFAGKPYRPIYDQALAIAQGARGAAVRPSGACWRSATRSAPISRAPIAFGIDCLFVTAGIHADELGERDNPDAAAVARHLRQGRGLSESGDAPARLVASGAARQPGRIGEGRPNPALASAR